MVSKSAIKTVAFVSCILIVLATSLPALAQPMVSRFPATENDEAWRLLPRENPPRENPPLPAWARILIQPLPKTTGAMLELDYIHRARNPIGPVLAAKLRWVAAETIGCVGADELKRLRGEAGKLEESDRLALAFARKMTRAAHEVTDGEIGELLRVFGPEVVVGMVHTLAYANFQNRIFLALGVTVEQDGPLPPIDFRSDPVRRMKVETPSRPAWEFSQKPRAAPNATTRPTWKAWTFVELEKALAKQKEREPRIPLPDASRHSRLAPEAKAQATIIFWTNISMGYQPLLTKSWFDCMRTFQAESKLDRVFANSMFWVITRSNECFY
jgi:hypothetical protein